MACTSTYYRGSRREVAQFLPEQYSRVLEIGCGEGGFRGNLGRNCEYWGVEPIQAAARAAIGRLAKVLVGTYEQVIDEIPRGYFDLVICNDVIEHMADHAWFLGSIRSKMSEGAHLVGSVPNVRYIDNLYKLLVRKDWQYRDEGVLDRTHLRFFTERSLERALLDSGFVLRRIGGINPAPGIFRRVAVSAIGCATFGAHRDIGFLQFGFLARRGDASV